jgi:hypothetical protein
MTNEEDIVWDNPNTTVDKGGVATQDDNGIVWDKPSDIENRNRQSNQPEKKQSLLGQLGQATLNTPNMLIRGMAEPLVKADGAAGLGINDALNLPGKSVQGYNVPFPGGDIPVQRMQTVPQAVGLGLQGGALAMGGNPIAAGATYGGGQAMANQESGMDIVKQSLVGAGLGYAGGLATGQYKVGIDKTKLAQEATSIYRNILRPSKSEINKIEVGKGGNIDNYYQLAAKEGLPIKGTAQKTLDTTDAVDILSNKQSVLHEELNQKLASDTTHKFNLIKIGEEAKSNLNKVTKNASELKTLKSNIDEYIGAEIERNGGKASVSATEVNNIKQGMWSVSYNKFDPVQNAKADSARSIGSVIKNKIESNFTDSSIQKLNKMSGDYSTLEKLLQNAHGRPIPKGMLARLTGTIAGHGLKSFPVGGSILGNKLGGMVSDALNNPSSASKFAAWKMRRALK